MGSLWAPDSGGIWLLGREARQHLLLTLLTTQWAENSHCGSMLPRSLN